MTLPEPVRQRRMSRYILLTALLLGMVAAGFVLLTSIGALATPPTPTPQIEGVTAVNPPIILSDFTLTNHAGESVSLSDLEGKLTVLFFGFTHCPDFCPTTLDEFKRIRQGLGDDADEVQFAFISVDGSRDTPDVLRNYLRVRGVDDFVIGMTGTEDEVRQLGTEYGLFFERNAETADLANYLVDHSTQSYLIDREGNLRVLYSYSTTPDVIVENIRHYL